MFASKTSFLILLSLLSLLLISTPVDAQTKCRALVLQGGGDKGAYQAGVLLGLATNAVNPEDFQYDVITGVSVGTLNSYSLGQFEVGREAEAIDFLVAAWKIINQSDVFTDWKGGILDGLFFKPSLFNSSAERTTLERLIISPPNRRRITAVSTDLNTGRKVVFDEQLWGSNISLAIDAAIASSAVPVVFTPFSYGNTTLVDGGWSGEGLDVEDAVIRCREVVDNDEDIIVDVIFANNISFTDMQTEKYKTFQVFSRYANIRSSVSATRTYEYARENYPKVEFRYVVIASQKLPNADLPLDFKKENIEFMINLGTSDGVNAIKDGPQATIDRFLKFGERYKI